MKHLQKSNEASSKKSLKHLKNNIKMKHLKIIIKSIIEASQKMKHLKNKTKNEASSKKWSILKIIIKRTLEASSTKNH